MRLALVTFLATILVPATGFAFGLNLGVGIKGGLNGSVSNGVEEGSPFTVDGQQLSIDQGPDIYPQFGLGGTFGLSLEARALDIVGLETGIYLSFDNANGFEDKNGPGGATIGRIEQEQRTTAFHIPFLAKASIPGFVRPTFGLGFEVVVQNSSTLKYASPDGFIINEVEDGYEFGGTTYKIEPSTYVNLVLSFALEFDVDPVRIPIELRFIVDPGFDSSLEPRLTNAERQGNNFSLTYDGVYQGQFMLLTGITYDLDVLF